LMTYGNIRKLSSFVDSIYTKRKGRGKR